MPTGYQRRNTYLATNREDDIKAWRRAVKNELVYFDTGCKSPRTNTKK